MPTLEERLEKVTTISYEVEPFSKVMREAREMIYRHWEEVGEYQDVLRVALKESKYDALDKSSKLHVLAARVSGKLVDYYMAILVPHLQRSDNGIFAVTDAYYIAPEYRKGCIGPALIFHAERTLRERGIKQATISCKSNTITLLCWKSWDGSSPIRRLRRCFNGHISVRITGRFRFSWRWNHRRSRFQGRRSSSGSSC